MSARTVVTAVVLLGLSGSGVLAANCDTGPIDFSGCKSDVPDFEKRVGPKVEPKRDACDATVSETSGVVTLSLTDATRAGTTTSITLDERSYAARFAAAGRLLARAPMFHATADLDWTGLDGQACHRRGIPFKTYQSVVLTALVWSGPFELALHVVEPPGGRIGSPTSYVFAGRPNLDHSTGLGDLQTFGLPGGTGVQVQLYTLPPERNPRRGEIYYFVEFVSRGNPAGPPFCGSDSKVPAVSRSSTSMPDNWNKREALLPLSLAERHGTTARKRPDISSDGSGSFERRRLRRR